MIKRLLIANRGEIACRVINTARRLGVHCIAVYSDADRNARHVRLADEAVYLGPSPARHSYLNTAAVLTAAKRLTADAIHPGYGFLSENADFAQTCTDAGIIFIGPPARAIELMGDKAASLRIMQQAGVPVLPGFHQANATDAQLTEAAQQLGYPLLIKPVAGGGGKGMQCIYTPDELAPGLSKARREAASAFGNEALLLERFLQQARHIEVQIICDQHGQGVWLAERDCSMQRRNQKVLEEAPAPGLSEAQRRHIGQLSIDAARAINYSGAGTLEFLFDPDSGEFYFMEMNTRLQVEHPVTEMITGLDLVELQLQVASGQRLPLTQADIKTSGHAIEARICAENPAQEFLPSSGRLMPLVFPPESEQLRLDTGVEAGDEISPFYDSMIAKLICHASSREAAIAGLHRALAHTCIGGLATNTHLLHTLTGLEVFRQAPLDTRYIERHAAQLLTQHPPAQLTLAAAAAFACRTRQQTNTRFTQLTGWQLNGERPVTVRLDFQGQILTYHFTPLSEKQWQFSTPQGCATGTLWANLTENQLFLETDGQRRQWRCFYQDEAFILFHHGQAYAFRPARYTPNEPEDAQSAQIKAPITGILVAVLVSEGEEVSVGQPLAIIEAMKMEYTLRAPVAAQVKSLYYAAGEQISQHAELLQLETPEGTDEHQ